MKTNAKRNRKGRGFDIQVCGRLLDESIKAKVEAAARRISLAIMGAKICNTITLKISLVQEAGSENTIGCVWTPTSNGTRDLRAFPITIDRSLAWVAMVKTLAHELRHVEQFRRGRLQYRRWASDRKVHARWDGVELGPLDSLPYWNRPWEIEARAESGKWAS